MFKQAGKLNAENNDKGLHSDDEEEPRPPNNRGQKGFPPQVRTVNMIYATHIPKSGAEACTKGRICDGASRPKVQSVVLLPDHF